MRGGPDSRAGSAGFSFVFSFKSGQPGSRIQDLIVVSFLVGFILSARANLVSKSVANNYLIFLFKGVINHVNEVDLLIYNCRMSKMQ